MSTHNPKRNHHYVWQYYLNPWLNDDQIWCFHKTKNKTFKSATKKIGFKRDFYELNPITIDDLFHIKSLALSNEAIYSSVIIKWFETYELLFATQKLYEHLKKSDKKSQSDTIKTYYDQLKYQTVEDFHTFIENLGYPYINHIRNNDFAFIEDPDSKYKFIFFILIQYFRTEKMMKIIQHRQNIINNDKVILEKFGDNISKISVTILKHWNLIALNYAVTLSGKMLNYKIIILKNITDENLITSDQPVISVGETTNIRLYFPLTPNIAVLIANDEKSLESIKALDLKEVQDYNKLVSDMAEMLIFSNSEKQLLNL